MGAQLSLAQPRPARRRSHAERTDLSDQRMFEAAVKLIVERGTSKTTLKEVGERAGYSRGLAGYRFGSKAGLFTFVVKSVAEEWLQTLTQVTRNKSGFAAICAATDAHYQFCRDAPDHVQAFYILWYESIGPQSDVRKVMAAIHERRRKDVQAWVAKGMRDGSVKEGVDPAAVAGQFCASIIGIVYQWLVAPNDLTPIAALHENLKATMATLLNPPEQ